MVLICWLLILAFLAFCLALGLSQRLQDWLRDHWPVGSDAGPPWTDKEISAFGRWLNGLALPGIILSATDKPVDPEGSRIGGPLFLREGDVWPLDASGRPFEFVAQLDFSALPPLPDFPEHGLLQFFVRRDDSFGYDSEDALVGSSYCRWLPDGAESAGHLEPPPPLGAKDCTPFLPAAQLGGKDARAHGVALKGRAKRRMMPGSSDWRIQSRLVGHQHRRGIDLVETKIEMAEETVPMPHHVGGHPVFTQWDFREPGHYDDYDRVLLRLTSDELLRWGDTGEAAFMIRHTDLVARDFTAVAFYWDCA